MINYLYIEGLLKAVENELTERCYHRCKYTYNDRVFLYRHVHERQLVTYQWYLSFNRHRSENNRLFASKPVKY